MNTQLVTPNLETKGEPGVCLGMQQRVWGAPGRYNTAWQAWQNVTQRTDPIPTDVSVLLWFDHWGTYGSPPKYGQYGHVATHVPGRGILSNPGRGFGQLWYSTVEQCERDCRATYVGWSPDINGLQIAEINTSVITNSNKKGKKKMLLCHRPLPDGSLLFLLFGDNFYLEFSGQDAANAFAGQIGSASAPVSQSFFDKVKVEVDRNA